jgi:ATP-dependent phosphoenolpyruvate carboxykinase
MNDLIRITSEGDQIVENWKTNQKTIGDATTRFRQHLQITRNRLSAIIGSNADFSDLKIIDQDVPSKLSGAATNLLDAYGQLPNGTTPTEYENSIEPYIGPFKRQLAIVREWTETSKHLADSSVSELSAERISR